MSLHNKTLIKLKILTINHFSIDMGQAHRNGSFYQCCSGFCIDLLEKFAEELGKFK